jgi:hypothetical protein
MYNKKACALEGSHLSPHGITRNGYPTRRLFLSYFYAFRLMAGN